MMTDLHHRVPATAGELPALRQALSLWSGRAGVGPEAVMSIVLASYEAMANVVDHAYAHSAGVLDIRAALTDTGGVIVTVTDYGHWRQLPVDPGNRGRGLLLMRRLATSTEVDATEDGTSVLLWWSLETLKKMDS
ncbi:ATP-binding protein [Fodinicola feengrottensis]|uniref:ATP-binding protein n=1 Tax=Fodinicola feengrottensis TaxID=435914 RepID=A0ABP4TYF2_9ACTN|nr:ATP-binding protein [Fodinicola feengrottensis]